MNNPVFRSGSKRAMRIFGVICILAVMFIPIPLDIGTFFISALSILGFVGLGIYLARKTEKYPLFETLLVAFVMYAIVMWTAKIVLFRLEILVALMKIAGGSWITGFVLTKVIMYMHNPHPESVTLITRFLNRPGKQGRKRNNCSR